MTNLQQLLNLNNQQGGTIHQLAKYYRVSTLTILDFDSKELEILIDNTLNSRFPGLISLAKDYYKQDQETTQDVANMAIAYKFRETEGVL